MWSVSLLASLCSQNPKGEPGTARAQLGETHCLQKHIAVKEHSLQNTEQRKAEIQKVADPADISVLFFQLVLIFGPFWVIFGPFCQ